MEYIIGVIVIIIFFWLIINKYFLLTILLAIIFAAYIFYKLSKSTPKVDAENIDFKPMVDEINEDINCILYKLDYTHELQADIEKAIKFDNTTSLDDSDFKGLSDDEILTKYRNETKIWQYDDPYGIGDFKLSDKIEEKGIPVTARLDDSYILVGYVSLQDSNYVNENRDHIESIRLIYHGGYYKFISFENGIKETIETEYDDYVLTLAICYNK